MASWCQKILQDYENFILHDKYADPRTKDWFLISSPFTFFTIVAGYLYFCTKAGPRFMEGRKPYELKNTLIVYNLLQVLYSCYLAYEGSVLTLKHNLICIPIDYTDIRIARACWMYFFAKITEFLDTIFFVLRKKNKQISFLHLYHHTLMATSSWVGVRYLAGGHGAIYGVINPYVHIVMYTYYLIASLGPRYQKYLWWKKYLTVLQLVQFAIVFLHNTFPLFTNCTYPKHLHVLILIFSSGFMYMFGSFYIQNYVINPKINTNKEN